MLLLYQVVGPASSSMGAPRPVNPYERYQGFSSMGPPKMPMGPPPPRMPPGRANHHHRLLPCRCLLLTPCADAPLMELLLLGPPSAEVLAIGVVVVQPSSGACRGAVSVMGSVTTSTTTTTTTTWGSATAPLSRQDDEVALAEDTAGYWAAGGGPSCTGRWLSELGAPHPLHPFCLPLVFSRLSLTSSCSPTHTLAHSLSPAPSFFAHRQVAETLWYFNRWRRWRASVGTNAAAMDNGAMAGLLLRWAALARPPTR